MRVLFLILIFSLHFLFLFAGTGRFYPVDASKGLTNLYINSITQDHDGFIWVGTDDGLFRYDGYSFKSFKKENDNENSIIHDAINSLFVDSKGRLWVSTSKGLCLYDSRKEKFQRVVVDRTNPESLPNQQVEVVFEDSEGDIWVGHYDGCSKLLNPDDKVSNYKFENHKMVLGNKVENWIVKIHEENEEYLWFGARYRGIYRFDKSSGEIINYFNLEYMSKNFRITDIISDENNEILISTFNSDSLYYYDKELNAVLYKDLIDIILPKNINDLLLDCKENLWVASSYGLINIKDNQSDIIYYKPDRQKKGNISSSNINCMFEDKSGGIWIGNLGHGLDYYYEPSIQIDLINENTYHNMPKTAISSLLYQGNDLYFISANFGMHVLSEKGLKGLNVDRAMFPLRFDGKSRIYSGTNYYDIELASSREFPVKFKRNVPFCFDENSNVYKLENKTLYFYDRVGKQIQDSFQLRFPEVLEVNKEFLQIIYLGNSNLLLLNHKYLFHFDQSSKSLKLILSSSELKNNKYNFNKMWVDGKDIWITANYMLFHFHLEKGIIQTYNEDKAWGDMIFSIIADNDHDVWLSTNKGILYLSINNRNFFFNKADNIPTYSFTDAITKSNDNTIFFGTGEGILRIEKSSLQPNEYLPPIVFTNFQLFNKEDSKQLDSSEHTDNSDIINKISLIELKHFQNYFSIGYAALNYKFSSKNQYAYYLEGLENDWNYVGNERKATYNGLPPGEYTFKVKASNSDGIWSPNERELHVVIYPPFWKTIWFQALVIFFVLFLIGLFFALRIRAINNKKKELEKQVRERTAEIYLQKEEIQSQADNLLEVNVLLKENQEEVKAQSDELFVANNKLQKLNNTKDKFFSIIAHDLKNPFQAINGFSEVLLNDIDDLDKSKAKEFIGFIRNSSKTASSLLENLLEWARTQTNRIKFEPKASNIHSIAEETIELLNVNAKNKEISLINKIPKDLTAFVDKNMITTVLRNLLNNAIKFTPNGGSVTFSGKSEKGMAEISIKDTGVGMDEKTVKKLFRIDQQNTTSGTSGESGTGLGLIISKEFLDKNNGKINVESEVGKGSKFILQIPIAKVQQAEDSELAVTEHSRSVDETDFNKSSSNTSINDTITLRQGSVTEDTEKPFLLIAEDTLDIRAGLKAFFEKDFKVIEAEDGEEGLKYALELVPDLIISDWMMPKMDGIALCEQLKTNNLTSHIPVIMLTAKSTPTNKIKGFETGADEYMTKPFDYSLLKVRVKNLIQSRIALQKKFAVNAGIEEQKIQITNVDQVFMDKLTAFFNENLDDSEIDTNKFCSKQNMSRSQFYRKVKALTGLSPVIYLRQYRIKIAAKFLKESGETVAEIMYRVGFSNSSYFAKSFKEVYNCSPSEYSK